MTPHVEERAGLLRAAKAVRAASKVRCVACGGTLSVWSADLPGFGWHCWPCIERMDDPLRPTPIYAVPAGWERDEAEEFGATGGAA